MRAYKLAEAGLEPARPFRQGILSPDLGVATGGISLFMIEKTAFLGVTADAWERVNGPKMDLIFRAFSVLFSWMLSRYVRIPFAFVHNLCITCSIRPGRPGRFRCCFPVFCPEMAGFLGICA